MRVSVAMCTYNGARFLPEQLASIHAQTLQPFEMVVCDDGSTDNTPALIEQFASEVSFPVRWIRNERNLGSTKNFEKAISLCTGELIALCDQDDVWVPRKLEALTAAMRDSPDLAGVFSDAFLLNEGGVPRGGTLWNLIHFHKREARLFARDQTFFLTRRPLVTGACFLFRADLRGVFTPIPSEWVHDMWIALCLSTRGGLHPLGEKLIGYRLHSTQQLGVRGLSKAEALRKSKEARVRYQLAGAASYAQAAAKLDQLGADPRSIRYARAKAAHMARRAEILKGGRAARLVYGLPLLRGHFRFGWGPVSYLRDCFHG